MINYDELCFYREDIIDDIGKWKWPKTDNGAWNGPSRDWINHKQCILKYCKSFRNIIQAGGNCGLYPALLSKMFEYVYTFEPDELNFHCLVNNCQYDNIYKFNMALNENNELVSIHNSNKINVGMHNIKKEDTNNHLISMKIDLFPFENIDMIWLDVEGLEFSVLKGAKETIKNNKPLIMTERGNEDIYINF